MADKAVDSLKSGVTSFWKFASGYTAQMFTEDDYLASQAVLVGKDGQPVALDRLQAQLYALASDPSTYLEDAAAEDKDPEWKCDLEKRQGEISDLMMSNAVVAKHYTELVPEKASHKQFWTRYFFKVHLIEIQEARRQALKKRAEEASRLDSGSDLKWDDDDEEPSEEMQKKLLNDYEQELIKEKLNKVQIDKSSSESRQSSPGASDDWEKVSQGGGEKSPKKVSRDEEDWVKP